MDEIDQGWVAYGYIEIGAVLLAKAE